MDQKDVIAEIQEKKDVVRKAERDAEKTTEIEIENNNNNVAEEEIVEKERSTEQIVVGRILTVTERQNAIKDLVNDIPSDLVDLWAYQVKWEYLNEVLLINI